MITPGELAIVALVVVLVWAIVHLAPKGSPAEYSSEGPEATADEIYRLIEHGDAEHRRWLRDKLTEWARVRKAG